MRAAVERSANASARRGVADRRVAEDHWVGLRVVGRVVVPAHTAIGGLLRLPGLVQLDPSRPCDERGGAIGSGHGRGVRPGRTAVR